jgi:hypothetical protein
MTHIEKTAVEMMKHAVHHAARNYYCAEVHSMEWSRWMELQLLGLARAGVQINEGRDQIFHVTPAGMVYLKIEEAK